MSDGYINLPITGGGAGNIISINGDNTPAQIIAAGTGIAVSSVSGTTTISFTGASGIDQLTGDVTAGPGSGSQAAVVNTVGGVTAAQIASIAAAAAAATSSPNPYTLPLRDGTGSIGLTTLALGLTPVKFSAPGSGNIFAGSSPTISGATGNIGIGQDALRSVTSGASNVAIGYESMVNVTTASQGTAIGYLALVDYAGNLSDVAVGAYCLIANASTIGGNACVGAYGFYNNTAGTYNVGLGYQVGYSALSSNNTFVGYMAGYFNTVNGGQNTIVGSSAYLNGDYSNAIVIGYNAIGPASNTVQLGDNAITGVFTSGAYNTAATQTTLTGSVGTALCSQPFQGSSYKKVAVYLNGYTDTGT